MGTQTTIAWTDASWNPITGCTKVSSGCANCYAERLSLQKGWSAVPWTKRNARENVTLHPERLDQPLRWRNPRKIFLCSMGDLFHELVPDHFIAKVFDVMARCPEHTFQLLTKRPARMADFVSRYNPEDLAPYPLPNLWLGTSVENQPAAEARLPALLRCTAALLFVSLEPLIAPVDLETVETEDGYWLDTLSGILREPPSPPLGGDTGENRLGWVIVGGESGPGYRPMSHEWVRVLRDQCITAEVPFFFKQSAGYRHNTGTLLDGEE
ncbi:MAG: DUF5131 family protein [Rubrobacteraceae bacterium]